MERLGGAALHDFGPGGLIARIGADLGRQLPAISFRTEIPQAALASFSPEERLAAGVWNDSFFGRGKARLPEPEFESGAPIAGCDEPYPGAAPDAPLLPMGLYIPSPPLDGPPANAFSSYMAGRIAVGVFVVQANGVADPVVSAWDGGLTANVLSEITNGANFMAAQNPDAHIEFAWDLHVPMDCDFEPISHPSSQDSLWKGNVLSKLGYGSLSSYLTALRTSKNAD